MGMTPVDHAIIGGLSGTLEVCLMQPTVAFKNAIQEGRPIPTNPFHLYRGVLMNCVSMAPITATQFGSNFLYNGLHKTLTGRDQMLQHEKFLTGAMAGATSAIFANPTELVVIHQQQTGRKLTTEVSHLLQTFGIRGLGVGIYATMCRESIYGCCWMEAMPFFKRTLDSMPSVVQSVPTGTTHLVSGVTAGVMSAVLSHPFDTVKTRMQAFIDPKHPRHEQYNSLFKAFRSVVQDDGYAAFFKGLTPRAFRITCAIFILSYCRAELTPVYERVLKS